MINTSIDIRLEGTKFSPSKLKAITDLPVEILAESGKIAQRGRYKGKPSPYGMALINVSENSNEDFSSVLGRYAKILLKDNKKALKESGVEEIIVDIETSAVSLNKGFFFEEKLVHNISELNARIEFQTVTDEISSTSKVAEPITIYKKKNQKR